ncbi:hypothetical protein MIND_00539300 [Mycena indigotica]|uniref:Ribosomal protein s17 n=1 Tax=Mycena indigotica TaxID=2126181 RepID=A0A8H6WCJ9_9AGAR|nr:uncharacterized protein MIND_00539300 [Mycena indigotica]KAF7307449.1 hypothetical protein MIND_00539300 [Mycena indigotica]
MMFSKSTFVSLFTLALSASSVSAIPQRGTFDTETFCNTVTLSVSTVIQTKTVEVTKYLTAPGSQATGKNNNGGNSNNNNGGGNSNNNGGGNSNNNNGGGNSNNGGNSNSNNGGGNNNSGGNKGGNGNGNALTTTSISVTATGNNAATQTGKAGNGGGKGGNGNNNGNGNGNGGGKGGNGNANGGNALALQTSLELDPSVVCVNFTDNGQNPPVAGQTASTTSTNNYINFCLDTLSTTPLTNGLQVQTGSCNPAPIGLIPSRDNMPSAKFIFPGNFDTIPANKAFNISMALRGMQAGTFTNAQKTYFAAPQQLNKQGVIIGHTHFVVEALTSLEQTTATDPTKFFFFKGINDAGVNGVLSTPLATGVPPGAYRVCSINTSANHAPAIGPVAQHGSFDDCVYFTATTDPNAVSSVAASGSASALVASASAVASSGVLSSASASALASGVAASSVASASASVAVTGSAAVTGTASTAPVATQTGKGQQQGQGKGQQPEATSSAAVPVASTAKDAPAAGKPADKNDNKPGAKDTVVGGGLKEPVAAASSPAAEAPKASSAAPAVPSPAADKVDAKADTKADAKADAKTDDKEKPKGRRFVRVRSNRM